MVKHLTYDADLIGSDNTIYLGGSENPQRMTHSVVRNNFQGTVRRVRYFSAQFDICGVHSRFTVAARSEFACCCVMNRQFRRSRIRRRSKWRLERCS